jgi:hypothetical protein
MQRDEITSKPKKLVLSDLLDNVKKGGYESLEVEYERDELALVELGRRSPSAVYKIKAEADE